MLASPQDPGGWYAIGAALLIPDAARFETGFTTVHSQTRPRHGLRP
jgi:hypothetical protein